MNISQVKPNTASKERRKMDVSKIQDLYDEGKFPEAMSAVMAEIEERESDDPKLSELYAICAWCHYRRKEWDGIREWLEKAGDTLRAKRLRAYIAAYEDKDDSTLSAIANELGDDVGVQNALVIRARDPGSGLVAIDDLSGILMRFVGKDEVDVANLFHNAARLFFTKGNTPDHFKAALFLKWDLIRLRIPQFHQEIFGFSLHCKIEGFQLR